MAYCTIDEAETYFAGRLYTDVWDAADKTTKTKALEMASRKIDLLPLRGRALRANQLTAFPRCLRQPEGYWQCDTEIPQVVKNACCEEALALLSYGNDARKQLSDKGVQSFSLDGMSETFKPGAWRGLFSSEARQLLISWVAIGVKFR